MTFESGFDFDNPAFTARPSVFRRYFGVGVQLMLGLILIYVAFVAPPAVFALQLFLIVLGALALAGCARAWRATAGSLHLSDAGLFDGEGRVIARFEDIEKIDRTLFTFKPSNGFLVKMKEAQPRAWVPGMWWRIGRRVGVGGMLSGAQMRLFADTLTAMLKQRDGDV